MTAVWIGLAVLAVLALAAWLRGRGGDATASDGDTDGDGEEADFSALVETVVVLRDNSWDACEIDGLREPWSRFTAKPTMGLGAVPAGRHRIVTQTSNGAATLDFVIYPGEIFVRRLDASSAQWTKLDSDAEEQVRTEAKGGLRGAMREALLSYKTTLGMARLAQGVVREPARVVDEVVRGLAAAMARATDADAESAVYEEARALGEMLVGVPLTNNQLSLLWKPIASRAHERAAANDVQAAMRIARIGLATLPGERNLEQLLDEIGRAS